MHRYAASVLGAALLMAETTSFGQATEFSGPIGFSPAARAAQAEAEARALSVPTPEKARSWLHVLTEEPHVAGTPADHKTALFVRDKLREWGWEADLAEHEVLLNYPVHATLELLRPTAQKLKTREDPHTPDKDSVSLVAFPAFHGYGVSGEELGQVVYVNYGRPEDFDALEKLGVDVKGKIVLARYGTLFRGLKVLNAQKRGAIGILIYSDPADDGYTKGDVYPDGPYRPASAIQRGSVQFLSKEPGDPSTPDGPSVKGANRLPIDPRNGFPRFQKSFGGRITETEPVKAWEKATGLVRDDYYAAIPSLPISYEAARPILEALSGSNVPKGWQGALPFAYHVGPGPAEVHFSILMDYKIRTIWNVIATLKGSDEPDRWVMIGNHRDAWVYGAVDPGSGTAATMEMCRALGSAVKHGWKPKRTLVYASWDAEEYGLVGSTEWAEEHAKELDAKAIMMLNIDSAVSGPTLKMDGVPSLRDLMLDVAGSITDPRTGKSLRRQWTDAQHAAWASQGAVDLPPADAADPLARPAGPPFRPQMNPLGSGSDYTVFVDHLGIPAVDIDFGGRYGVYHSIYDNFYWMEKFGDPEFLTHVTAAKLYTLFAMRAAGSDVLPLRFSAYGDAISSYVDDLRRTVERQARSSSRKDNAPTDFPGLADLLKAVATFQSQADALDRATIRLSNQDDVDPARLAEVNNALQRVERAFLNPDGLPGRPWFKHSIYAPGLTTGYACWPLPGVYQAIHEKDKTMLAAQAPALTARIHAATEALKTAADAAR